jgi:hypothetical protein
MAGILAVNRSFEMSQAAVVANPFLLMVSPEVVLAAVEKSERLSQLNRHLCRPLDRPVVPGARAGEGEQDADAEDAGNEA